MNQEPIKEIRTAARHALLAQGSDRDRGLDRPNSRRLLLVLTHPEKPDLGPIVEVALQRADLEVTPEIGFYTLRRGDGT